MKKIAIIILAITTIGFIIPTVMLAIHSGALSAEKDDLQKQIVQAKVDAQRDKDINDHLGMATCLIHGDATPEYAARCRATVQFFLDKPLEELEEYVKKVGYGL